MWLALTAVAQRIYQFRLWISGLHESQHPVYITKQTRESGSQNSDWLPVTEAGQSWPFKSSIDQSVNGDRG